MRVFRSVEEARGWFEPSAVMIGNFDGLHAAHMQLVGRTLALAAKLGVKPSALTFHPHPATIVAPERAPHLLTSPDERAELMAAARLEQVLILPFTLEVSHLTPAEFASGILKDALGARGVVVGDNFHFGVHQSGKVETLRQLGAQLGFEVDVVAGLRVRGVFVSSGEIRRLVTAGNVAKAARLLGRWFRLAGPVVKGAGRGAKQTVPTLNMAANFDVLPADGVYITTTTPGGESITNIGVRPTFGGTERVIETYLLGSSGSPERIAVDFHRRVREERKFASAEELRAQILRDVERAREWHRRYRSAGSQAKAPGPPSG